MSELPERINVMKVISYDVQDIVERLTENDETLRTVTLEEVMEQVEAWVQEDFPADRIKDLIIQDQDGEDNCKEHYVTREELQELNDVCMKVWTSKSKEVAEELLPTQVGFFYGSYEIDDWYWEQIEDTLVQLGRILSKVPEGWSFAYDSSW